jgi:hypothetical protein
MKKKIIADTINSSADMIKSVKKNIGNTRQKGPKAPLQDLAANLQATIGLQNDVQKLKKELKKKKKDLEVQVKKLSESQKTAKKAQKGVKRSGGNSKSIKPPVKKVKPKSGSPKGKL